VKHSSLYAAPEGPGGRNGWHVQGDGMLLTNIFMCNNIFTYEMLCFERRTKMYNFAIIIPVIGMIGFFVIVAIRLVIESKEKREEIKSVDAARFNSFAEEMRRENAEMKKDLQIIKEKVEAIDKMMKDI